jgi:hypothetical protein
MVIQGFTNYEIQAGLHEISVYGLLKQCAASVKGLVVPADIKIIAKKICLIPHCIEIIAG